MGLFGKSPVQYRMQLFHYDNGDLEFIRRRLIGGSPTELDDGGHPHQSWIDHYQTLYPFDGYKTIPGDAVQMAYGRHFHMEIHDILNDDDRPPETSELDHPFISAIAEARAVEITRTAKPHSTYDRLMLILGTALILEFIIWGIAYAVRF